MSWPSLRGKRQCDRRRGEHTNFYVDRYDTHLRLLAVALLLLSTLDAFFTLRLLEKGGEELNPLMAWLLDWNSYGFIAVKLVMTALALAVLLTHCHFKVFNFFRVSTLIHLSVGAYTALIGYEVVLLVRAYAL